jgi:hypothetical protein
MPKVGEDASSDCRGRLLSVKRSALAPPMSLKTQPGQTELTSTAPHTSAARIAVAAFKVERDAIGSSCPFLILVGGV